MADKHEQRVMVREDAKLKSGQAGSETHGAAPPLHLSLYLGRQIIVYNASRGPQQRCTRTHQPNLGCRSDPSLDL